MVGARDLINMYTDVVCKNLKSYSKISKHSFDTVYFGGGTPSLLGSLNLIKIMNTIKDNFEFSAKEVTIEINPKIPDVLDLQSLKENGFNRISIGVQSGVDEELKALGRQHSVKDVEKTIKLAKEAGFSNISIDLMLSIPNQTLNSLKESINFCILQNVQHISAYMLKIEEGTLFYKHKEKLNLKNDDETAILYLSLISELKNSGFKQYEISNFAKGSYQSKHNLKYWQCEEYLGIGPSAHSFVKGKRFFCAKSLKDFFNEKIKVIDDGPGGTEKEYIMLNLRLSKGINKKTFKSRFGYNLPNYYFEKAKRYQKYGLTLVDEENIKFTARGFLVSNQLISKILY